MKMERSEKWLHFYGLLPPTHAVKSEKKFVHAVNSVNVCRPLTSSDWLILSLDWLLLLSIFQSLQQTLFSVFQQRENFQLTYWLIVWMSEWMNDSPNQSKLFLFSEKNTTEWPLSVYFARLRVFCACFVSLVNFYLLSCVSCESWILKYIICCT